MISRQAEFAQRMNDRFKAKVILSGDVSQYLTTKRLSSGSLSLDCCIGGGYPFHKICILAGYESTGKTSFAFKACESVTHYDYLTRQHEAFYTGEAFEPCMALFVDVECRADAEWAEAHGVLFSKNCDIARTDNQEQAIDLVTQAISENIYGLIVIDSLAALAPIMELSKSSEDNVMGVGARKLNLAIRKWTSSLAALSQDGVIGPCILCLNQFRASMALYGDPRSLPGGMGQKYASCMTLYANAPEVSDGPNVSNSIIKLRGKSQKNSTFHGLRKEFSVKMCCSPHEVYPQGAFIDNLDAMKKAGLQLGLIKSGGKGSKKYSYESVSAPTQSEIMEIINNDEVLFQKLWQDILYLETGYSPDEGREVGNE